MKTIQVQVGQVLMTPFNKSATVVSRDTTDKHNEMWYVAYSDGGRACINVSAHVESYGWKLVDGPGCERPMPLNTARDTRSFAVKAPPVAAVFPSEQPSGLFSRFVESPTAGSHRRGCKGCIWHGDASGKPCFCSKDYEPEAAPVARAQAPKPVKPVEKFDVVRACDDARMAYMMTSEGPGLSLPGREGWGARWSR